MQVGKLPVVVRGAGDVALAARSMAGDGRVAPIFLISRQKIESVQTYYNFVWMKLISIGRPRAILLGGRVAPHPTPNRRSPPPRPIAPPTYPSPHLNLV